MKYKKKTRFVSITDYTFTFCEYEHMRQRRRLKNHLLNFSKINIFYMLEIYIQSLQNYCSKCDLIPRKGKRVDTIKERAAFTPIPTNFIEPTLPIITSVSKVLKTFTTSVVVINWRPLGVILPAISSAPCKMNNSRAVFTVIILLKLWLESNEI